MRTRADDKRHGRVCAALYHPDGGTGARRSTEAVTSCVRQLILPQMHGHDRANIIAALAQVPSTEHAALVHGCLPLRQHSMREASHLTYAADAIARTPHTERPGHAARLLQTQRARAVVGEPMPQAVDTENVMRASRQNAADKAIWRLFDRFPQYAGSAQDMQEIGSHLKALSAHITVPTARQAAQWRALAAAAPQTMAHYMPAESGRPESGTELASWLGHLGQFAYVGADRAAHQSDKDRHVEAFVAHVRHFETAAVPILGRVRGASMATELANAQRNPSRCPAPRRLHRLRGAKPRV